ncbi:hypothetical protein FH972_014292 [Carpinus fangiana]|uniref:Bifunctional inhibitor/plant lipid transfer protein/seed storage helical domain-containing protein n=1 Tax=Carpinus fangiana TaxID=176857 RepID=A0A5N6R979_9ROSI|nr:hypothetical protein FH972_014292 [Carpinus fangiana]
MENLLQLAIKLVLLCLMIMATAMAPAVEARAYHPTICPCPRFPDCCREKTKY